MIMSLVNYNETTSRSISNFVELYFLETKYYNSSQCQQKELISFVLTGMQVMTSLEHITNIKSKAY